MSNDPWRNARVMYEKDTCARKMGIELIEMDDGFAQMSMTVSADMLNGHQTCHGGQLFTLADTAFAYACNSQGLAAVASAASIDFLRPAFAGPAGRHRQSQTAGQADRRLRHRNC
ncbi:hypothetical protein KPZU09_17680 [Klebsiella pneumoniae]|uniref:Thioesterase domain-containing protein n=1 Tax=Klebsiella pneumoniae TaxID=573 RepID=A0A919LY27_KLEPN|nr:hypothetical protein KPZU09_17680 [Klebsiella pneumoniae]